MCDPTTLFSAASLVVSTVGSAVAASQQASAQRFNARVLEQRAARERQLADVRARQAARENERALARQRARFGAAGVLPSVGSPLLVQEEMAAEGKFQQQLIRAGGETQAARLTARAGASRAAAGRALIGGGFDVGTTLLGSDARRLVDPLIGS